MRILRQKKLQFCYIKKGSSFLLLPFFMLVFSCSDNLSNYGRVTLNSGSINDSFIFLVNEEFLSANYQSLNDKKFPKITEAELKLLKGLLNEKKYCLNRNGKTSFVITSRQEKIYDMTFAHLIEQNYRAQPIAPRMYFGQCASE